MYRGKKHELHNTVVVYIAFKETSLKFFEQTKTHPKNMCLIPQTVNNRKDTGHGINQIKRILELGCITPVTEM